MNNPTPALNINPQSLTSLVQKAAGRETAVVTAWSLETLAGGFGEAAQGVFRLLGKAQAQSQAFLWSIILKILAPAGGQIAEATNTPSGWNYWKREALAYQSDIRQYLPSGLCMPRGYAVQDQPDGSCWLWLEDVKSAGHAGTVEHSAQIARLLGRFNGQFLEDSSLLKPFLEVPWLSRRWLQDWIADSAAVNRQLHELHHHPLVLQFYPPHIQAFYADLWQKKDHYLNIYYRLPQTFCHRDVFARNILLKKSAPQAVEYNLIDWNFCGFGPLGEELVSLVGANLAFAETPLEEAQVLQTQVLENYLQGLAEAGWTGDPQVVRLGYAIGAALRYTIGVLRLYLPFILMPGFDPQLPSGFGSYTMAELGCLLNQIDSDLHLTQDREAQRLIKVLDLDP